MGSYMSAEPPRINWNVLHGEVSRLGEDFDLTFTCEGHPEDGVAKTEFTRCDIDPGHPNMKPLVDFKIENLPEDWRVPKVYHFIRHMARFVVKIQVLYTSEARPTCNNNRYPRSNYRGLWLPSCGSGFADIPPSYLEKPCIDCPVKDCPEKVINPGHKVTPVFIVRSAAHVVYDDSEAETATVIFFYESEGDDEENGRMVKASVLRMDLSGPSGDTCLLLCVSHDLKLFEKLFSGPFVSPVRLPSPLQPQGAPELVVPRSPLVVIISHPHGYLKHVSTGRWVGYKAVFPEYNRFSELKISTFMQEIEEKCPDWRKTGYTTENGEYWSPETVAYFYFRVQQNPSLTFAEGAAQNSNTSAPIPYITYSTSTCPGSSGARVWALFEVDGVNKWDIGLLTSHFRKKKLTLNQSGEVAVLSLCSKEVDRHLENLPQDVRRKKNKSTQ